MAYSLPWVEEKSQKEKRRSRRKSERRPRRHAGQRSVFVLRSSDSNDSTFQLCTASVARKTARRGRGTAGALYEDVYFIHIFIDRPYSANVYFTEPSS